jgi:ADP-heptose:LPS heptosyltransferase
MTTPASSSPSASSSGQKHNIAVRVFDALTLRVADKQRLLLLKLDHIGDFFTALPAFRLLRGAFPGAEITLICLPGVVALAQGTGLFDRVAGFRAENDSAQIGAAPAVFAGDLEASFEDLLDGRYGIAIDFKHDANTRKWLDSVDAGLRAGFAAPTRKGLDIALPNMEWDVAPSALRACDLPVHAELRLSLLAHAVIDALVDAPIEKTAFGAAGKDLQDASYRALADEKRFKVGVSLGAGSELRQWDHDYWLKLLLKLTSDPGMLVVFLGGPGDKDATAALAAQLTPGRWMDLTAGHPLSAVPAYFGLLDAYIGCDTGQTHLAAIMGLPTVNIFAGASSVPVWRARGPRVKTIYAEAACAPCHLRFRKDCPNHHVCMKVILPEMVFTCFEQVIAPSRDKKPA